MSSASKDVLNSKNGWTSSDALNMLTAKGNDGTDKHTFTQLYKCPDPSKPGLGFPSWDAFFTREFQDHVRPIAGNAKLPPGTVDPSQILVHACESTPCLRQENVQLQDTFWLKSQPYSLADMLNSAETAAPFVGGQVYQAFLSALSYHRWHAPVSGKVVSIEHVQGTFYSENFFEGFNNPGGPDPAAPNNSQPYIPEVATRAIITIQADNPKIRLMAIVFIGMCEVSSCEFFVKPGDRIAQGHQIGSFHFGGSTHCLVFHP